MNEVSSIAHSPTPNKRGEVFNNFYTALQALAEGRRITRIAWQDANVYGYLREKVVSIMTFNEKLDAYEEHTWAISYEDLFAEDWMVLD